MWSSPFFGGTETTGWAVGADDWAGGWCVIGCMPVTLGAFQMCSNGSSKPEASPSGCQPARAEDRSVRRVALGPSQPDPATSALHYPAAWWVGGYATRPSLASYLPTRMLEGRAGPDPSL